MDEHGLKSEAGLGLIELLISMVILQVAMLALLAAFGSSAVALGRASGMNTGAVLADAQMELYRAMPYDAIGLDTAAAPVSGMYVANTTVCPTGKTPVCGNTGPRNNVNNSPWSCTAASGSSSVSLYFTANGANPCVAHRTVTGAGSPDGNTYFVDTYIIWGTLNVGERSSKQVTVVVRNGAGVVELAKVQTTFDCSGQPTAYLVGC